MCTYLNSIEFNAHTHTDKLHKIPIKVPEALQIKCVQCRYMCTSEHTVNHIKIQDVPAAHVYSSVANIIYSNIWISSNWNDKLL